MINRPQSFGVDDWRAFPDANELRRDGEIQKLESRVMNLLVYLHRHRGEVVGRDELINEVWGKEALSDHSISVAIGILRRALGDNATHPRYIETVRKKGYRLIAACAEITAPVPEIEAPAQVRSFFTKARAGIAALTASAAAIAAGVFFVSAPGDPTSFSSISDAKPLIIVEDFQNATNDPDFDELAVILSDLFLAELARDNRTKIQRAEQPALAGSLLEGDIQQRTMASVTGHLVKEDDDLYLSIYIEDPRSSEVTWSDNQIVDQKKFLGAARLVTAKLLTHIVPDGSIAAPPGDDGDEMRLAALYQLGLKLESVRSNATTRAAHSLAREALEIDPEFGPAHSLLAFLYAESSPDYWGMDGERYARAAKELALARQYGSDEAHNLVTDAYLRRARDGRPDIAARLLDRAIDLAPNDPWVLRMSVETNIIIGEFAKALAHNIRAAEASLDPSSIVAERTFPLYFLGRYEEAVDLYEETRALDLLPVYYGPQAAILSGDNVKGFQFWIDLLREHDVKIADETLPIEWIANGDTKTAFDWLQQQLPDDLSPKNVPLLRASMHMTVGDSDTAMEVMLNAARRIYGSEGERAAPTMLWSVIQYDPLYKDMRNDPRMEEVLDLVGIVKIIEHKKNSGSGAPSIRAFASPN